jgi:orotate phosphoribosyltransferase
VVAPAVGGIVFGYAVAQALGTRFIFAEREEGKMTLRRAFEIERGTRVLVAEDVVTTGGSVKEVVDVVREQGGEVVGVVSLIDRGGERKFDEPFYPLLPLEIESWDPLDCGLCADGVDLYSPGSRQLV